MKKNSMNGIFIIIALFFIAIGISMLSNKAKKDSLAEEEIAPIVENDNIEKIENSLLNKLIKSDDYKTINIDVNKYNALKNIIYYYDVENLDKINGEAIFQAITYNVKDKDIRIDNQDDFSTYGYINKEIIDSQIKILFNDSRIKISTEPKENEIGIRNGNLENVSQKYRTAELLKETKDEYYFYFSDTERFELSPILKELPIKIINAKEYDDYILVTSKAVYAPFSAKRDNKYVIEVFSDNLAQYKIKTISVDSIPYDLKIDDYLKEASTIYTIFKKENNDYYFYKNYLNN